MKSADLVPHVWYRSEEPITGSVIEHNITRRKYGVSVQFTEGTFFRRSDSMLIFLVNPLPSGTRIFVEVAADALTSMEWSEIERPLLSERQISRGGKK